MTFGDFRLLCSKAFPGTDADLLDNYINSRYAKVLDRRNWKGLEADARFVTVAAYSTGTVALTLGSNAVTGTGTVFTALMTGRNFRVYGDTATYTFTRTGATTATLDRNYEGTTNATAAYLIYQDTFDLAADYKQPLVNRNERCPGEIVHWTRQQLDRAAPVRLASGEPEIYCFAPDSAAGLRRAQLYPTPAYDASYPYSYIRTIARFTDADTATAIAPWVSIEMLMDFVKADCKSDQTAEAKAERELALMVVRDINIEGSKKLRMSKIYTRHRIDRVRR